MIFGVPEGAATSGNDPPQVYNSDESLRAVDARLLFYDALLTCTEQADYLQEHIKIDRLWDVFEAIDDFAPTKKD